MIDLAVHTTETAPEGSKETLARVEAQFGGFAPNVVRQMAEAPVTIAGSSQLLALLDSSSLTKTEQQVVLLTTAYQYNSDYCVAGNSAMAQMSGVEGDVIDAIRKGQPLADPKVEALRILAAEMVGSSGRVSESTAQRFFDAGYSNQNLFEVILGIATETLASFTDRVSGVPIDDEFKPFVWKASDPAIA